MKYSRWLFVILGVLSGCFAFGMAQADVGNVTQSGQITGTGATQWLTLNGQGSCVVVLGGTFTGVTIVPQTSGDNGITQQTASAIGSGSLTSAATYWGPIVGASNGVSLFRLNTTGFSTGPVNYVITCTPAGGTNTITGSVSISGTVNTNITGPTCANSLPCVQVSSLPGPAITSSPSGVVAIQPIHTLTGDTVAVNESAPDAYATPVAIATASTTLLYSGTASKYTVVWSIAVQSTGTNTSDTENWEWGTGATCGTGTQTFFPAAIGFTGATGNLYSLYPADSFTATGGQALGGVGPGFIVPLVAANICIVTTSATVALKAFGIFSTVAVAP